jgi:DsbC/DsbD-like thiol-disulfide interchange protein
MRHLVARLRLAAAIAISLLASTAQHEARAAASQWSGPKHGRVRLIAGGVPATGGGAAQLHAGVQIRLEPGWKTYWRSPGEAGVPPHFDWTGSENLAEAQVLYPAPVRFTDAGMDSFGYLDEVTFPVRVTAKEAGKPVRLSLALEYGVCKDICMPMEAKLALTWTPGSGKGEAALIEAAFARVPGRGVAGMPEIVAVKPELGRGPPRLVFEARYPRGAAGADLVLELSPGVMGPMAKPLGAPAQGLVRFEAKPTAGEAEKLKGAQLLATLLGEAGQAEVTVTLP